MAKHFTIGGYPNPDPYYISAEEEAEILAAEYDARDSLDYEAGAGVDRRPRNVEE